MKVPHIEIIPSMELAGGLVAYVNFTEGHTAVHDEQLEESRQVLSWKKTVQSEITPFLENDVKFFFSYATHYFILCRLIMHNNLSDPAELISFLRKMTSEEFTDLYKKIIHTEASDGDPLSYQNILEWIENDRSSNKKPFEEEAAHLKSLFCCPSEFKDRFVNCIETFFNMFIGPYLDEVSAFLMKKKTEHTKLLKKNSEAFLERLTVGVDFSDFRLVISYYNENTLDHFLGKEPFIVYGFAQEQRFGNSDTEKMTDLYIQALSDPKRLAVLRLLKNRPYYGKELAKYFGVTTATISYHIEKLSRAGLIVMRASGKNRIYYSVNRRGIEEMVDSLRAEFL